MVSIRKHQCSVRESSLGGSSRVLSEGQGKFLSDWWLLQGERSFNMSGAEETPPKRESLLPLLRQVLTGELPAI